MLIDKPRCNFKNCRYCFDSNCISADKYENCKLTDLGHEIAKLTVDLDNAKSEVAREIFEEIEKSVASKIPMKLRPIFKDDMDFDDGFINGKSDALIEVLVLIAELKKKYTEGET